VWESTRRWGRRLERKGAEETAAEMREGREREAEAGKEAPERRTWTGTAAERERRREGRSGDGAESARRSPGGRAAKVSLEAEGSRAAADARKESMPAYAAAVAAGASEIRRGRRSRIRRNRAMFAGRPEKRRQDSVKVQGFRSI
jgi:hypothetical protein